MLRIVKTTDIKYVITIGTSKDVLLITNNKSKAIKYAQLIASELNVSVIICTINGNHRDGLVINTERTAEGGMAK